MQPADRALDLPASTISTKLASVLSGRDSATSAMRTDQFDPSSRQSLAKRVAVGSLVVNQSLGASREYAMIQQRLDERYLVRAGAGDRRREGQTAGVGENHRLSSLSALGLADHFAPFFADEKVPSANVSPRSRRPSRSSRRSSRAHALVQTPAAVHWRKRRQQVAYEGNRCGRSFQRAPLRSTHRIPSTHRRGSIAGRPHWPVRGSCGNRSAINRHCSSVSTDLGSILDPAGLSTRCWRDRVDISGLLSDHQYEINQPIV